MYRFEHHCPVARSAEVLTEPWTLLVLRELMHGSERRTEIARGLPKISDSMLGARLRTLVTGGVVTQEKGHGGEKRYRLTEAGQALRPVLDQLGRWGQRWLERPRLADLDPESLLFDICREIDRTRLPARPLTVDVDLADAPPPRRWSLVLSTEEVTARRGERDEPGEVRLSCTIGALADVWLGHVSWLDAVREQVVVLSGDPAAVRSLIDVLGSSRYATKEGSA